MKEIYTKPEINVMMDFVIGDYNENEENRDGVVFFSYGDIEGGKTSGKDDGEL